MQFQTDRHLYLIVKLRVVPSGAKSTLLALNTLIAMQTYYKSNELYNKLNSNSYLEKLLKTTHP